MCLAEMMRAREQVLTMQVGSALRKAKELEDENAKLRELADAVKEFVEDTHCEDCPFRRDCGDNNRIFCADVFSYHDFAAMRELRIGAE